MWLIGSWRSHTQRRINATASPTPLVVRGLVVDAAGQVFLVRYPSVTGWHFPGGNVKHGESSLMAVARELEHSGNILVSAAHLHGLFFNERTSTHIACYVIRDFRQNAPPGIRRDIAEAEFFPTDRLPADTSRATHARLREVLQGAPIARSW